MPFIVSSLKCQAGAGTIRSIMRRGMALELLKKNSPKASPTARPSNDPRARSRYSLFKAFLNLYLLRHSSFSLIHAHIGAIKARWNDFDRVAIFPFEARVLLQTE